MFLGLLSTDSAEGLPPFLSLSLATALACALGTVVSFWCPACFHLGALTLGLIVSWDYNTVFIGFLDSRNFLAAERVWGGSAVPVVQGEVVECCCPDIGDGGSVSERKAADMPFGRTEMMCAWEEGWCPWASRKSWPWLQEPSGLSPGPPWHRKGPSGAVCGVWVGKNNVVCHFPKWKRKKKKGDVSMHQATEIFELCAHNLPLARISNFFWFLLCEIQLRICQTKKNWIPLLE